jgi:hypothetical protein
MQDAPSADLRDQAIRAALHDAATLAAMVMTEFRASYWARSEPSTSRPWRPTQLTSAGASRRSARGISSRTSVDGGSPFGLAEERTPGALVARSAGLVITRIVSRGRGAVYPPAVLRLQGQPRLRPLLPCALRATMTVIGVRIGQRGNVGS